MNKKDLRKNRTKAAFIEATKQIIETENIEAVNARKIGDIALYNSATIYNYFSNLDHLIILASVEFIKSYLNDLQKIDNGSSPKKNYLFIWDSFIKHALCQPDIYYRFFFNNDISLDEIFKEYFEVYPEQKLEFPEIVNSFIYAGDIYGRNLNLLTSLFPDTKAESLERITSIHVSLCQSLLINCKDGKNDREEERKRFHSDLDFSMLPIL